MRRIFAFAALAGALLLLLPGVGWADDSSAEQAAAALAARAEEGDTQAIAALVPYLHATDSKVRYHATWGLARAGEPAVPVLLEEFRRLDDDASRARVARVLGQIGLAARVAIPEMREALRHPNSSTASRAAYALGSMRAWEALPDLVDAYARSRRLPTQRQISRAIRRIGSDQAARAAKQALVDSVRSDLDATERKLLKAALAYAEGLYRAARDDKDYEVPTREELRPLLPGLIGALEDPDPAHSLHAIRAIALAGRSAAEAAPVLEPWLHDPRTTHEARKALRAVGTPEALEFVARMEAREALEKRIRRDYTIQDHQGRTRLLPFHVAGAGPDGVRMEARFLYDGREPKRPGRIVVAFESTSESARLEDVTQVEWLADATPIRMVDIDRSWSSSQSGVIERVSGTLPLHDFLALAHARTLRARLGPVEFVVEERDRAALYHFAGKIPEARPPASAE